MNTLNFDYHYGTEADQYTFLRIPRLLITAPHFKKLSMDAKVLYGLMLDRMGLSMKNQWLDKLNRVYIYFTLEDIQECLSCGHNKGVKLLAELDTATGIGLIERIKQGQGKPTRIYVKNFNLQPDSEVIHKGNPDFPNANVQTSENRKSRLPHSGSADFPIAETNYNNQNQNDFNDTEYQSIYPGKSADRPQAEPATANKKPKEIDMDMMDAINTYREVIRENIEYVHLCSRYRYSVDIIDELIELMVEAVCSTKKTIRISGNEVSAALVKSKFLKMNSEHIEYILDCLDNNNSDIRNIKSYLLTTVYNAPNTIGNYYKAAVNHNMRG